MNKRRIYHIIEWVVALAACAWLVWKMVTYDAYAALWDTISGMSWQQIAALVLCVALMPVNMSLEAWRWKTLIPMSWYEAHRQVYYSKLAGLITPWRLGEYPARAVIMANGEGTNGERVWARVLSMGAVGSATMTIAIIAAGMIAMIANGEWLMVNGEWWITVGAVVVGAVLLAVAGWLVSSRILALTVGSPSVDRRGMRVVLFKSLGQSFVRLVCWCVQLALVIWALGGIGSIGVPGVIGVIGKCAIYYLLVTITPNVPIAEVGVRGAWAIAVFGTMNAALAGVLLWAINTLLPCVAWFFFKKK